MPAKIKDPVERSLRRSYSFAKNQARYRNQSWDLAFEDYAGLWLENDRYRSRGRCQNGLQLSRKDLSGPWTRDNIQIVNRSVFLRDLMLGKQDG